MADRKVTVRVDIQATSNVPAVAQAGANAARSMSTAVDAAKARMTTLGGGAVRVPSAAAGAANAGVGAGTGNPAASAVGAANVAAIASETAARTASLGSLSTFRDRLESAGFTGMNAFKGLAAAAGTVAAASPAAFETLTGSLRLVAGEIGITLIPAVVTVSGWLQTAAATIKNLDESTGGLVGKVLTIGGGLGLAAVGIAKIITVGETVAGVVSRVREMFGGGQRAAADSAAAAASGRLAASANVAAAALTRVGGAGAVGGVTGVASQAGGGIMSRIGSFLGSGRGALLAGAVGTVAGGAMASGERTLGGFAGAAASGAAIGAIAGPLGAALGAAGGIFVNAIKGISAEVKEKGFWKTMFPDKEGMKAELEKKARADQQQQIAASMNFRGGSLDAMDISRTIQSEVIRDPMQAAQFDQQARASDAMLRELRQLNQNVQGLQTAAPWQANQ